MASLKQAEGSLRQQLQEEMTAVSKIPYKNTQDALDDAVNRVLAVFKQMLEQKRQHSKYALHCDELFDELLEELEEA